MAGGLASTINGIYSRSKYGVQAPNQMKEYFGLLKMTVEKVLSFIILMMIGTLILFYAYFARKGDLE